MNHPHIRELFYPFFTFATAEIDMVRFPVQSLYS